MSHWSNKAKLEIEPLEDRLHVWTSSLEQTAGFRTRQHAYFLVRDGGNCLFHGPDRPTFYKQHRDFFDRHGGIGLQLCSHAGDVSRASAFLEKTWGTAIYASKWEASQVSRRSKRPFDAGFENGQGPGPDLEGIHMPGHTAGFHCFRWRGDAKTYLFASHMIIQKVQRWDFALTPLLAEPGIRSLRAVRDLDVDLLLPSKSSSRGSSDAGRVPPIPFGPAERAAAVDEALAALAKKLKIAVD